MKKIDFKQLFTYSMHVVKDNGIIKLTLKSPYSELTNTVNQLQLLNNDIKLTAKIKEKVLSLGMFRIGNLVVDGDGETKVTFASTSDYVELNNINALAVETKDMKEFYIRLQANVEEE